MKNDQIHLKSPLTGDTIEEILLSVYNGEVMHFDQHTRPHPSDVSGPIWIDQKLFWSDGIEYTSIAMTAYELAKKLDPSIVNETTWLQSLEGPVGPKGAMSTVPGPKGDTGPNGLIGPQGVDGPVGAASILPGPQGDKGDIGDTGPQGITGDIGIEGPIGLPGIDGVAGAKGDKGTDGVDGAEGLQGPAGASINILGSANTADILLKVPATIGDSWIALDTGVDSTGKAIALKDIVRAVTISPVSWITIGPLEGPEGVQGVTGAQGATGDRGPKGDAGLKGTTGAIGPIGLPGTDGTDGMDSIVPGPQGIKGDSGNQGATGLTGPIGTPGADGTDGIDGTNGIDGADGADSTIPGPEGIQGVTGPIGDIGAEGPEGPQGIRGIQGQSGITNSFATVVEMKADTLNTIGDFISTEGYYAPGDGGGNRYEIVPLGTGTADGGAFINLSQHQAKAIWATPEVYLRQFGVTGDGSTNDSPAIQAAFDYGVAVQGNPGDTYLIGEQLFLTFKDHAKYDFTGTVFKRNYDSTGDLAVGLIKITDCTDLVMIDFTYNSNGMYGRGFSTHRGANQSFIRLRSFNVFENFAFSFSNSTGIEITDCHIVTEGQFNCDGLHFFGCSNVRIIGGYIEAFDDCISITAEGFAEIQADNYHITGIILKPSQRAAFKLLVTSEGKAGISNVIVDCVIESANSNTRCINIENFSAAHKITNVNIKAVIDNTHNAATYETTLVNNIENLTLDITQKGGVSQAAILKKVSGLFGKIVVTDNTYTGDIVQIDDGFNYMFEVVAKSCPNATVLYTGTSGMVADGQISIGGYSVKRLWHGKRTHNIVFTQHAGAGVPLASQEISDCDYNVFNNSTLAGINAKPPLVITGANTITGFAMSGYDPAFNNDLYIHDVKLDNSKIFLGNTGTNSNAEIVSQESSGNLTLKTGNKANSAINLGNDRGAGVVHIYPGAVGSRTINLNARLGIIDTPIDVRINGVSIVSSGTGWVKYSDGTMQQYGAIKNASATPVKTTFPQRFVNTNYRVTCQSTHNSAHIVIKVSNKVVNGFSTWGMIVKTGGWGGTDGDYIAIGKWK